MSEKTKKFFSTLSLHKKPEDNDPIRYELDESCGNMVNIETRNPVMLFLRNNVEAGENIELYLSVISPIKESGETIEVYNERTKDARASMLLHKQNYEDEIEEIKKAIGGFNCKFELIEICGASNRDHHKLMRDIVRNIADGDIVFMDITFGFKTVSVLQFLALTYAYKIRRGVEIGAMSYGSLHGNATNKPTIYNLTEFFLFNNTMNNLTDLPHPEQLIDRILNNLIEEDEGQ